MSALGRGLPSRMGSRQVRWTSDSSADLARRQFSAAWARRQHHHVRRPCRRNLTCSDLGELTFEDGRGRPAVPPFHLGGNGGQRAFPCLRRAVDDEGRPATPERLRRWRDRDCNHAPMRSGCATSRARSRAQMSSRCGSRARSACRWRSANHRPARTRCCRRLQIAHNWQEEAGELACRIGRDAEPSGGEAIAALDTS
jgi:hypothetical protein